MKRHIVVSGVACCTGLVALLLRRLWHVNAVARSHRKRRRRRRPRAWIEQVSMWHTPLLLLGVAIVAARLAFFTDILVFQHGHSHDDHNPTSLRRRLWCWLELPSAFMAIALAYLIFFHAHVALYHVWSIQWDSTSAIYRILFVSFSGLLLGVVALHAYGREMKDPILTPQQWTVVTRTYFMIIWIVLGTMFLKFAGQSADVMWREREVGRLFVISPRGLHTLLRTETLVSLIAIARGIVTSMKTTTTGDPGSHSHEDPGQIRFITLVSMYGIWELLTVGIIYRLCSCVPVVSRARRLVGDDENSSSGKPVCGTQPVLHFELLSPTQALQEYLRSATGIVQSRNRIRSRSSDVDNMYEPSEEMDVDVEDHLLLDEDSFHEPLLFERVDE